MNRYLKIILIGFLSFATLAALGSGIVSYFFQDEVMGFVIENINKFVSTRIQVESAHFSAFRKFPNAAVEFRHVKMSPAGDFDTLSFEPDRSRHLLSAEKIFIELNLFRLLTGDYRITQIEVHNGNINQLTDKNNRHNFIFWKTPDNSTGESSPIELQNVTLRNMNFYYGHRQSNTVISLYADRAQLSGRFTSRQYSLNADWHGSVQSFSVGEDVLIFDKSLEFSGKLDADDNTFTICSCDFMLAKVKMTMLGGFTTDDGVDLDLQVESKQLDYASLVSALPELYGQKLHDYPGKGNLNFTANIKGKASGSDIPHIEARFGMTQGQISHRKNKVRLSGLSFTGTFTTGEKNRLNSSILQIRDFESNIGGGTFKGNLTMQNFVKPQITAKISSIIDLEQLHRFFPDKQITSAGGAMRVELTVNTQMKNLRMSGADDIEQLVLQGTVILRGVSLHLHESFYRFSDINGSLQFGNRVTTNNLALMLNGNNLEINGYMEHLSSYLLNRSKTLYIKADVRSQQICVDSLLTTSSKTTENMLPETGNNVKENAAPLLPDNIEFETNLEAAKFRYMTFEAENMKAHLVYHPRVLEIRSSGFSSMSGKLTGTGVIANDGENHIQVRGETMLDRFEVKELFRSFNNFGQDVLRAEHVKGRLSGDLGFAIGWDSRLQLQQEKVIVEGLMNLNGGELANFEPMNNLSLFVALEELQNIRFSNISMRISVKDRKITFPQTDIQTSAFDITGSGEHLFDNSYTYHVKILLSELLAAKARRAKRENRENEYLEESGKRSALYLKVAGKGSDFKISYDTQAAKASIAEDIRNEKQTLKSILKEEFGWFRKDTLVKPTTPGNTGKLRFTFDDE